MTKMMNDESRTEAALDLLGYAYEHFEFVTDAKKRLEIMDMAKDGLDAMFDSIIEQNPTLSLPEFVKLMDLAGKPVAPELREQLQGMAAQ